MARILLYPQDMERILVGLDGSPRSPQVLASAVDLANAAPAPSCSSTTHGYGGLDRVLGTTAAKIVNHAEVSVLVVKPERRS